MSAMGYVVTLITECVSHCAITSAIASMQKQKREEIVNLFLSSNTPTLIMTTSSCQGYLSTLECVDRRLREAGSKDLIFES
jgi:tRNA(Phe) wybutosine-synthesizing methylase Tyw3